MQQHASRRGHLSVADEARGRPRGRPQALPVEPNELGSPTIDPGRRLAWVLATNRLLSPDARLSAREPFIAALQAEGVSADSSRVSRWESARLRIPEPVLAAYERLLGLPDGAIASLDRLLRRTSGRSASLSDAAENVDHARLDELFAAVEAGRATGGEWLHLATGLARTDRVYVHPDTWQRVTGTLVSELTRSGGVAMLRRFEAASLLIAHPRARAHLSRQVGEFVTDPDAQNMVPALALLRVVGDEPAAELVLRLLGSENGLLRRGAAEVAGSLASQGVFTGTRADALERFVGYELRRIDDVGRRIDVLDLVGQVSEEAFARLHSAVPEPRSKRVLLRARTQREIGDADLCRIVAEGVATFAEAALGRTAHDPDLMLRRLVREALFHTQRERRHLAAVTLSLSPYARAVGRALLELTTDPDTQVAAMAWSTLRRLGHVVDRETVATAALRERRDELRPRALLTLGLCHGPLRDGDAAALVQSACDPRSSAEEQHAAVFALGMAGHPCLQQAATSESPMAPAARWWLRSGPSLHDDDVVTPG
ncbi:hypothetical protein [Nocardioides nanhaiensis]